MTVPPGVARGSTYYLVFVTNGGYQATSTSLSTYNTEVNTEANADPVLAALDSTWLDIGSTASESAVTNIGTFRVAIRSTICSGNWWRTAPRVSRVFGGVA